MGRNKEINNFFSNMDLFKELDYDKLYNKLLYGNISINNNIDIISSLYEQMCECNKKMDTVNKLILIEEGIDINYDKRLMEVSFTVGIDNINGFINEFILFLKKKKIKYYMKVMLNDSLYRLIVGVLDKEGLVKITDYVNDKFGKVIENINPLMFSDDKVSLSFNLDYSYDEILAWYLYRYIRKCDDCKNLNYVNFKKFILDVYFKITNQVDMYSFLEFNKKNICLSRFFLNLEIVTTLMVYLFNEKDIEDYCDYFRKLKKDETKNINVYDLYDDLSVNMDLFKELVSSMYLKYGEDYARGSIINYMNTGKRSYITRGNDLRKRIIDSKTFMVFLHELEIDNEISKIVTGYKLDNKKKILESICKETYLTCNDCEKNNSGKIHIARTLIRISCGDYSSVTRNNDARKMAIENIEPTEVVSLIKDTLKIESVKKESTLYELYAEYIEKLCLV